MLNTSLEHLGVVDLPPAAGYERLLYAEDKATGLNALISVHSSARGPAAGGCRMFNYAAFEDAVEDVQRLSRGMTYKNAGADLPLGGGKSVIIGDPRKIKTPALMTAFGEFVSVLEGNYYTAEDVGISPEDLVHASKVCPYVVGLDSGSYASGDPSPYTAQGVFNAMQVTWAHLTDTADLSGVTVSVQGLGHVGMHLPHKLHEAGARLTVTDLDDKALDFARTALGAEVVAPGDIYGQAADIFAPCAMGAVLNPETISQLKVRAVVGAANNQLATDEMGQALLERGIVYAPDYVANGGGIINAAMEILKVSDPSFREQRLEGLFETLSSILKEAKAKGAPPHRIADTMMERRLG